MKLVEARTRCVINLMTITIERYLKVVHPFWSKRNLKRWMMYAATISAASGPKFTIL